MSTSTTADPSETDKIAAALAAAMGDVGKIKMTGKNKEQGYAYASDEDLLGPVQTAMSRHGLALLPVEISDTHTDIGKTSGGATKTRVDLSIRYRIIHSSGQSIDVVGYGQGWDTSDKAGYKAQTGALKYLVRTVFAIPVGLDVGTDAGDTARQDATTNATGRNRPAPPRVAPPPPVAALPPAGTDDAAPDADAVIDDDTIPAHWTDAIDAAMQLGHGQAHGPLLKLIARIDREEPNPYRKHGAIMKAADAIGEPGVTSLADFATVIEWATGQGSRFPFGGEIVAGWTRTQSVRRAVEGDERPELPWDAPAGGNDGDDDDVIDAVTNEDAAMHDHSGGQDDLAARAAA